MTTVDGFEFDASATVWRLAARSGPVTLDFGRDIPAGADLLGREKELMTRLIACNQALEVRAHHEAFTKLVGLAASRRPGEPVTDLVAADLRRLVAATAPGKGHQVVSVRDLVLAWDASGIPGLGADLVALARINDAKVPPAGRAVAMLCPNEGSLSEAEMDRVVDGLHAAFKGGAIALDNYLLCLLATTIVIRPLQMALLKVGDLVARPPGSESAYVLSVPRVKQRGPVRGTFNDVDLNPAFGDLLWQQRELAIHEARACGLPEEQAALLPGRMRSCSDGSPAARLPDLAGHMSRHAVSIRVSGALNRLGILSDRTGEPLNIFCLRLRRTAATLAYASGWSLVEISALLDHTSPDVCIAYVERSQELFTRVAAAGGKRHADIARAMLRGRVRNRPTDEPAGNPDGEAVH